MLNFFGCVLNIEGHISTLESSEQVSFSNLTPSMKKATPKTRTYWFPTLKWFLCNQVEYNCQTFEKAFTTLKFVLIKNSIPLAIRTGPAKLWIWFKNGVKVDILFALATKSRGRHQD